MAKKNHTNVIFLCTTLHNCDPLQISIGDMKAGLILDPWIHGSMDRIMIKVYDLMLTMNLQIQVSFLINPRYSDWIVLA